MTKTLYPIGLQDFSEIRKYGYVYVDKTTLIHQLITTGKYYFLSRPRRFGKSLLLSTLEYLFEGRRDLFSGLAIDSLPWKWEQHPVLHLDLNVRNYDSEDSLDTILDRHLRRWEKLFNIVKSTEVLEDRFINVIEEANTQCNKEVVILIDEYDKPLFSTLNSPKLHNRFRSQLQAFFSVLKSMDRYIKFAMLTGVTRFSKVSIFSGLNNLTDISIEPAYNALCGISEAEVDKYFTPSIEEFATANDTSVRKVRNLLKKNYRGYRFSLAEEELYNPFSLLSALRLKDVQNFWFETGTPSFLANMLKSRNYNLRSLEKTTRTSNELKGSDETLKDIISIFYQTGYLTITDYNKLLGNYTLGYPNREVEQSILNYLIPYYSPDITNGSYVLNLVEAVIAGDVERFMVELTVFFNDFPYDQIPNLEVHYQNVVYIILKLMGFYVRTEYHTFQGRIDMVIETDTYVYVVEFKLGHSPKIALEQIVNKGYCRPFDNSGKQVICIGVNFNRKTRVLDSWQACNYSL